jgi:hypothetical protein
MAKNDKFKTINDRIIYFFSNQATTITSKEVIIGICRSVFLNFDTNTEQAFSLLAYEKIKLLFKIMYDNVKSNITESQKNNIYIKYLFSVIDACISYPVYI